MRASDPSEYEVRPFNASDWPQVRDIRLEMLADSPTAYVEKLADAQQRGDDHWRARAATADQPHWLGLAGVSIATGRWIALARSAVFADRDDRAYVFNVYVAPAYRGRGVADDLLDVVEHWARGEERPALFLFVHELNARAIAFYQRRGYDFTGARTSYPLDPSQSELEMCLLLHNGE